MMQEVEQRGSRGVGESVEGRECERPRVLITVSKVVFGKEKILYMDKERPRSPVNKSVDEIR